MRFKVVLTNFIILLLILGNFCLAKIKYDEKPNTLKNQSKKSLIKKELFKRDWILREDIHVFSKPVNQSVQANIYQNKDRLRLAFFISPDSDTHVRSVDLNLNFNPMYFFIMGKPVLYDTQIRERNNIDYKFKNELVIFRVKVSRYVKYIEFNVASRKLGNLSKLTIEDKIKQARTIRRIKQKLESWSQLAPGQIIAQETLRPIISHGGYAVNGMKRAVIWANNSKLTGKFELIDALNNVQHPDVQPVMFTGDLKESGNHVWGGNNYIADFSDFRKEGLYFVRLKINETREVNDSYVFPIKKNLYFDLAKKAAKWFNFQRCGIEVPGFHKACHMQDTIIKKDGTKVDVSGGWHDAGDYGKWIGGGTTGVFALTMFQDEFGNEFKRSSRVPELTDEAAWEARYFCKGYWDGAFHPGFTGNFENVCEWLGAPECEPPRIVMEKEMLENSYGPIVSPGISMTGASLAKVASQMMPYDKEFAKKCITIAEDAYNIDSKVNCKDEEKPNSFIYLQSGLLLSDVELYKITKDKKYKKDAEIRVENIIEQQIGGKEGFFYYDEAKKSESHADCRFQMLALYEYYKAFPESKLNKEIKNTFKRWADYMMKYADVSSFGLIGGKEKDGTIRSYRYQHAGNRRIGAVAWGLATAAILLHEPKYLEAAEFQLQWIVGFNPADISMMAGIGKGPGCYHHRYCFMEGCEHGIVPGGILNGIMNGNGETIEIGDITKNFIIADLPVDYPVIDTDVWGWTFAYVTNEYWTRNNSWFVLGAFQIEKAMSLIQENNTLFIAPSGNDNWSGKLSEPNKNETDGPFATFQKAQETIRELKKMGKLPADGVTVYVREGNYSISKTIKLTTEDSGEKNAPITWRSYPGERVVFSGGKTISGFMKIRNADVLKRIEKTYHDSILVCDLQKLDIFDSWKLKPKGLTFHPRKPLAMKLFFSGKAMTLARYPNEGWLKIATVPQFGTELIYKGDLPHKRFGIPVGRHYGRFKYESDRPEHWHKTEDIWMHGYWSWDWSDTYNKIEKIDTIKKEIYPAAPYNSHGYTKGQRFYFLNVLEELDSPGEYYINRKTGKIYFWPPENINKGEVTVPIMEEPFFVLENTSYINIECITFECSRTTAVKIIGGNSNKIAGCVFRNLGNMAVIIDGGKKNGILSCDIYGIAGCGIQLTGGDRKTLTSANNYAENNHIHNFGRIFRTYSPAISMNGVGNRLSYNHIHDSPHAGVLFGGNEHILEFNEINDIAKETGDVGAFYIGRNWTCRGNIIRYNYFHHLFGPGLHGVRAVYLDDFSSGTTIFGNVFYKAGRAAFIGGGRDNIIENNIFVECDPSVQVDGRGLSWAKNYFNKSDKLHVSTLFDGMDAVNFSQSPYSEKYPELLTLYDDDPAMPKNNKIVRNVSFGGRFIDLYDKLNFEIVEVKDNLIGDTVLLRESQESDQSDNFQTFKYGHVETMEDMKGNKFLEENPGFKDIEKGKFQLNDNSPAYKLGFKKIPIEKIGLYIDEYRKSLNSKNKENTDIEKITAADTNVFEGNYWRNQALTDIMPYWLEYSLDTVDGAFITNFDRSWNQIEGTEKYPSMISRHIFGYSVAYLFTGEEKYLKIASDAVDFLLEHAWDKEYGGWYNRLDKQGNPTDSTKNTFVQFYTNTGLSLYYLVTHDKNVLEYIEKSNKIAETKRRDPVNDGFYNILNRDLSVKDYNKNFSSEVVPVSSYMLYLYLATRNDKYLHQAERIMNLALDKMQCPETNWIIEPFDKDWNCITKNSDLNTEINIGHNQEVVWMFYRLYLLTGKKEYLDSTKAITEKIYKWGVAENGAWYSSCGRKDPSMHTDFSYWWIQVYGNMFDVLNYKLTGDKEYLVHFKKGADFWNKYFIDKKYGETYRGVFLDGKIKDDIKAAADKTSYHSMEYSLLISLYLDLWVNEKPVELYYCIQSPEKNERFYPSPIEDLSVKIEKVTINGEDWTDFNKDEAYVNLPELEKVKMKVVLK